MLVSAPILEIPHTHASSNEEFEWAKPNVIQTEALDQIPALKELSEENFDNAILTPQKDETALIKTDPMII